MVGKKGSALPFWPAVPALAPAVDKEPDVKLGTWLSDGEWFLVLTCL